MSQREIDPSRKSQQGRREILKATPHTTENRGPGWRRIKRVFDKVFQKIVKSGYSPFGQGYTLPEQEKPENK